MRGDLPCPVYTSRDEYYRVAARGKIPTTSDLRGFPADPEFWNFVCYYMKLCPSIKLDFNSVVEQAEDAIRFLAELRESGRRFTLKNLNADCMVLFRVEGFESYLEGEDKLPNIDLSGCKRSMRARTASFTEYPTRWSQRLSNRTPIITILSAAGSP